jgi:hypothetical protein
MLELAQCSIGIVVREADRDERGVPAPLVWIKARRRFRPAADVVPGEDGASLVA